MCGRYTITKQKKDVENQFNVKIDENIYKTNYNAAPTQILPVITNDQLDRVNFFKWGLVPYWAKNQKIGNKMINARIETITEKPAYKQAIQKRRCMIIADGYYEWVETPRGKKPYYITMNKNQLFSFAGVWESWKNNQGKIVKTFSIITQIAYNEIEHIHHRMPVKLNPKEKLFWLNAETAEQAIKYVKTQKKYDLKTNEVSTEVNSPDNNYSDLTKPIST
tara:strand:- start:1101 stop:1763 length:663 start_codon:yes stop_codon:yes gene_type:complete